jgi:hypothetical protein
MVQVTPPFTRPIVTVNELLVVAAVVIRAKCPIRYTPVAAIALGNVVVVSEADFPVSETDETTGGSLSTFCTSSVNHATHGRVKIRVASSVTAVRSGKGAMVIAITGRLDWTALSLLAPIQTPLRDATESDQSPRLPASSVVRFRNEATAFLCHTSR